VTSLNECHTKTQKPVSLAVTMTQKSFSSSACDVALVVGVASWLVRVDLFLLIHDKISYE
jgi:hypothetical protein